jgi:hypothetical protein
VCCHLRGARTFQLFATVLISVKISVVQLFIIPTPVVCYIGGLLSNLCLYSSLPVQDIIIPGQGWNTSVSTLVSQEKRETVLVPQELTKIWYSNY